MTLAIFGEDLNYVGEWKDDKMNGQGTLTEPNGVKYIGEWKDDKMNGQGTEIYSDGDKYVGEWKDGKKHGRGIIYSYDTNEVKSEVVWQNDEQVDFK